MAPLPEENGGVKTSTLVNNYPPTLAGSSSNTTIPSCTPIRKLENEEDRLRTFDSWPLTYISKESLVAAGFYFLKKDDLVKCPFCGLEVGCWDEGDDPMEDHRKWAPNCRYVKAVSAAKGNPICTKNLMRSYDVCGFRDLEIRPYSCSERGPSPEHLGIKKYSFPKYPQYSNIDQRLKTFEEWPKSLQPRPNLLAEAGFWYTGKSDETNCFHCGGGLKDWDPTDDPLKEHAKWYSDCLFVQLNRKKLEAEYSSDEELLITCKDIENLNISFDEQAGTIPTTGKVSSPEAKHSESSSPTLEDNRLCKVCFQEELAIVTLPCSHLVTCVKCVSSLDKCPVCRQPYAALVRVFM